MGRNGLLTSQECADKLGISLRGFLNLVERGHIFPLYPAGAERNAMHFRPEEIDSLERARRRDATTHDAYSTAHAGYALARSIHERLERLSRFIGLDEEFLSHEFDDVVALYLKTEHAVSKGFPERYKAETVYELAKVFNSITESYLHLTAEYARTDEPWRPFIELSERMLFVAPVDKFTENRKLASAYGYLKSARANLLHVCHFYVRLKEGSTRATELFPDGVDEEVIAQLFPK
jgi:GR25 family glycosyltransferase involved in LPS biosynthesis